MLITNTAYSKDIVKMNFINHIPVAGQIKGFAHLLCGDDEEGIKCLKQANRSSFVAGGAIVGSVFGLPGACGGAAIGGTTMDCIHSVACDTSEGTIRAGDRILRDIEKGRNPTRSSLNLGVYVAADAFSGYGTYRGLPTRGGIRIHPL
ncbi:unnamed protein product [Diatraea saccharalis]|uniref:Uncharacterized protein n=1 Tax=Diatraea saccharalis TaxID=40085 RepID=A0A9N9WLD2_9NEOP|nr:unnamed protein product [Diatraea saccharalis]